MNAFINILMFLLCLLLVIFYILMIYLVFSVDGTESGIKKDTSPSKKTELDRELAVELKKYAKVLTRKHPAGARDDAVDLDEAIVLTTKLSNGKTVGEELTERASQFGEKKKTVFDIIPEHMFFGKGHDTTKFLHYNRFVGWGEDTTLNGFVIHTLYVQVNTELTVNMVGSVRKLRDRVDSPTSYTMCSVDIDKVVEDRIGKYTILKVSYIAGCESGYIEDKPSLFTLKHYAEEPKQ